MISTNEYLKKKLIKDFIYLNDEEFFAYKKTLISILDDVTNILDKNNIPYFLAGGTCLGAVRHKGFIPWDDDVDILMFRKDIDKLKECLDQEKYWIHTPSQTTNYGLLNGRIRLKGTVCRTREDLHTDECGALIDIFPIENTYDSLVLRYIHGLFSMALMLLVSCRKMHRDRNLYKDIKFDSYKVGMVFKTKMIIGLILSIFSLDFYTKLSDKCNSTCKNSNSKYIVVPSGRGHFFGEIYLREYFNEHIYIEFEKKKYKCNNRYDIYLAQLYGDYMTPTADSEKEKHMFYKDFKLK